MIRSEIIEFIYKNPGTRGAVAMMFRKMENNILKINFEVYRRVSRLVFPVGFKSKPVSIKFHGLVVIKNAKNGFYGTQCFFVLKSASYCLWTCFFDGYQAELQGC